MNKLFIISLAFVILLLFKPSFLQRCLNLTTFEINLFLALMSVSHILFSKNLLTPKT